MFAAMAILEVKDLHKSYKKGFIPKTQKVLKGLNFKIEAGTITGFLGGNGAGKTTTMKCMLGLAFLDSGEITYFGGQPLSGKVKSRIGFLPEHPYFYDYLTGIEFLEFYGQLTLSWSRKKLRSRIDQLLAKVDLVHAGDKKLRDYSKGMLQKVGMAQALIHEPEFIILDEPMAGLDPDGRGYISDIINETASSGTAIFFSSHLLHDAERLCQDLIIIRDGLVRFSGKTEKLLDRMGQASIVTFLEKDLKHSCRVKDLAELQNKLDELRKMNATVLDIRQDRNLEQAFTLVGLRGEEL